MFLLIGLICADPVDMGTCKAMYWHEEFAKIEECMEVGASHVGGVTEHGIVVAYKCEAKGENI